MVAVFRAVPVPVAAGAGALAPATTSPNSTSAATARPAAVIPAARAAAGGIRAGNVAGAAAAWSAEAFAGAGASASAARTAKAATSTMPATMPAGGRAPLLNPEQPDPDRQEVPAEGGEGEAGSRCGGQPAREDEPVRNGQHRQPEAEGRDHLQQEQPADGGDRPVAGHVQVEVDRRGGDQQAPARDPQADSGPAARRRFSVLRRGSPRRP